MYSYFVKGPLQTFIENNLKYLQLKEHFIRHDLLKEENIP